MYYFRYLAVLIVISFSLMLQACGGGNSGSTGQAQGTTVALQAQVKTGSATILFSQYTSATNLTSLNPSMDFTLKSVINSNAGAMASDVNITSEVISYEYIDSTPAIVGAVPNIPSLSYNSNLIVPAGGTTEWANVPILTITQKQFLKTNNVLLNTADQMRYRVKVTFNGYEVKNGSTVSVSTTGTVTLKQ